jgi:hypothetical protein
MVEGAKSFFKSTASEIDDKNFRALSNIGSYTNFKSYSAPSKQNCRTYRAVRLVEEKSFSLDKPYF